MLSIKTAAIGLMVSAAFLAEPMGYAATPDAGDAAHGKPLYRRYCIGCHGTNGDGMGENGIYLNPRPRDFTTGTFKCRSTPTGTLPLDSDLATTINRGLYASAMPPWRALTAEQRADLLAYVKDFCPRYRSDKPGTPLQIPPEPANGTESVGRGNQVYQRMECWKCHGKEGRGNGPSAPTLTDSKERPIVPYDFTMESRFKCGETNADLYRIFMTGLDGTPNAILRGPTQAGGSLGPGALSANASNEGEEMIPVSITGRGLLTLALLLGLLAMGGLIAVAMAAPPDNSGSFSITLPVPYTKLVDAVREICADGVIRGTAQYEEETILTGADPVDSSTAFPRWTGPGAVFFKSRTKAVSPTNFVGSRDQGAVTVRYVVEPGPADHARITIEAVFVENSHHGRHASKGFVEQAEFGAIAKLLKSSAPASPSSHVDAPPLHPAPPKPSSAAVTPKARAYPFADQDLKAALTELGAFDDVALPMLEGFTAVAPEQLTRFDRPHYQFRIQFEPDAPGRTSVKIEARISALYSQPWSARSEYRAVPSNGRLETDLLDRLETYLGSRNATSTPDAASVRPKVASLAGKQ